MQLCTPQPSLVHYLIDPLLNCFGLEFEGQPEYDDVHRIEDHGAMSFRENSMT